MLSIELIRPEVKCFKYHIRRNGRPTGNGIHKAEGLQALRFFPRQHVHSDIKEVVKPFDWSYSTDYKGSISSSKSSTDTTQAPPSFQATDRKIRIDLLSRPDPILFFSSIDL